MAPARLARPDGAYQPAGRGAQRTAAVVENRPTASSTGDLSRAVPAGAPVSPCNHRLASRHSDGRLAETCGTFKRYYRPNNATLTLVGDFDTAAASVWCRNISTPSSADPRCKPAVVTPALPRKRLAVTDRIELERLVLAENAAEIQAGGRGAGNRRLHTRRRPSAAVRSCDCKSRRKCPPPGTHTFDVDFCHQTVARSGHTARSCGPDRRRTLSKPRAARLVGGARNQIERALQSLQKWAV